MNIQHKVRVGVLALGGALVLPQMTWAQPTPPVAPPVAPPVTPPVTPLATPAVPSGAGSLVALRDIDREVTGLSNDITASHTRLQQITAMVLERSGGGGLLLLEHQNDMTSTFRLVRATYALDGVTVATRSDDNGSLAEQPSFTVYNGRAASGEHQLTVTLEYQGNGYGIFSYIRGYTFRARSVQTFTLPEGQGLRLTVVGYERGGATTAVEDRPAIRYQQQALSISALQAQIARSNTGAAPAGTTPAGAAPAGSAPQGARPAGAPGAASAARP